MLRSRFLWKLYAGYALLIVLTALVVGALVATRMVRDAVAETDRVLLGDATLLRVLAAEALAAEALVAGDSEDDPRSDFSTLERRVREIARATASRLTVIRADGEVIADSTVSPSGLDNHGTRPEIVAARADGIGRAGRLSRTLGQRMRYVALAFHEDGAIRGFARAAIPLVSVEARLAALRRLVVLGAAIATLAALALAFVVAQRITRPLHALTAAAQALSDGDYSRRVVTADSADELGLLANAFNVMRDRLRQQLDTANLEQSRLAAILGSMVEGVVAVDREERVVHINQVAADLLGVVATSVQGRRIWEVTRGHGVAEVLREAMAADVPAERELLLPGRADRVLELRATPLRDDASGKGATGLGGAVLVLDDVTTVRHLETVRQDFVGNVSHELKTPVTAIRGLAETLIDDPHMPVETQRGFLARIRDQSLRLSRRVVDLLSLSRLAADHGGLRAEPTLVQDAVHAAVDAIEPMGEAKSIRVEVTTPDAPVRVLGEMQALEEAGANLRENAIKYSPEGGTVEAVVESGNSVVAVTVTDHGIGIASQHLDRIFERFYRVDKARSRSLGGTGLGLAIVKHIVRSLNGDVRVTSEPGAGSAFTIRLPRHRGVI
jgi:two-component system phosphate regulon sensor histidine kinase PhoR